jgi:Big-like domain-containing protein
MAGRGIFLIVRLLVVTLIVVVCTTSGALVKSAQAAVTSPELVTMLQGVSTADGHRYSVVDDQNLSMDTVKIIANPQGGYLGVYQHLINNVFQVRLATSTDLLTWHYVTTLQTAASQATIASLSDGGFLVGYEKDSEGKYCGGLGSCLAFKHYTNLNALLAGVYDRSIVLNRTLSLCTEGTPNIYAATLNPDIAHSIINVGFHYYSSCYVDREAVGTLTNFSSWKTQADTNLNTLFSNLGTINGNIGDRDAFFYQGHPYSLIEAQSTRNDYSTWRPYLFDRTLNSLTKLSLQTNGGSTSFGNPTYTEVTLPNGQLGFVSTEFIFSQGAAPGEGGALIYYKAYPTQPSVDTTAPSVSITQPANNSKVSKGSTITIKASASDDVGVAKVAFYVNGTLTCVSPFAPYTCSWTVPSTSRVTYTITAQAFDIALNSASSSVQVTSR